MNSLRQCSPRAFGYGVIILHVLVCGSYWPIQKYLTGYISPAELNWLQMVVITGFMIPPCLLRRRVLYRAPAPWRLLLLFSLVSAVIYYSRNLGIQLTSASTGAIVTRSDLAFSIFLAYLVLGHVVTRWAWVGTGFIAVGALLAMQISLQDLRFNLLGLGALLVCSMGVAVNGVIFQKSFTRLSSEFVLGVMAACQTVIFTAILLPRGELAQVADLLANPPLAALGILSAGVIVGMLFTYYAALRRIPLANVRILALMIPALAMVGDHFVLHSPLSGSQVGGLIIVTLGAALVITKGEARSRWHPSAAAEIPS